MPCLREVRLLFELSLLLVIAGSPVFAQTASQSPEASRKPDLPVGQWLAQGERTEIPWNITVTKPQATYRLVSAVQIQAELKASVFEREASQPGLLFIVKVARQNGGWDNAESYTSSHFEQRHNGKVQMLATVSLKPGAYTVATMLYDAASGKRNLSFRRVEVKDTTSSDLAELLSGTPEIRFLGSPEKQDSSASGHILLPLRMQHAVAFDLIVDLSTREQSGERLELAPPDINDTGRMPSPGDSSWPAPPRPPRTRRDRGTATEQTSEQSRLLEIARALAEMDFQPGCTRVTALDVLRLRTLLPPTPVGEVDWQQLGKENSVPDKVVVSVTSLEGRKKSDVFFEEQIEQAMTQPPSCKLNSEEPLHVIAVLSHGIHFPSGSKKPRLEAGCRCRVFYFYRSRQDINGGDDLRKILEPLRPRVLEFDNPEKFRERVLEFTEALKSAP